MIGTVKWFNEAKGYGFIHSPELQTDIFASWQEIQCEGFQSLSEGQPVEFELYESIKGPIAKCIIKLNQTQ